MTAVLVRDKILACRLLASALFDLLPHPKGMRIDRTKARAAASAYEPCLRCGGAWLVGARTRVRLGYRRGSGWHVDRFRRRTPCEACGGHYGHDGEPVPGAGRIGIDPMMNERWRAVGTADNTRAARRVEKRPCPTCTPLGSPRDVKHGTGNDPRRRTRCRTCDGSGLVEVEPDPPTVSDALVNDPATVIERALDYRDESGSFHELELCLAVLRRQNRDRHRVYWQVAVLRDRTTDDLDETELRWLDEADRDLAAMMPDEIRVPGYLLHAEKAIREQLKLVRGKGADPNALRWRNTEIRRRFESGEATLEHLIRETGLSRSSLYEIVYGGTG